MSAPITGHQHIDYGHPLWPCKTCGCPQGEHDERWEFSGWGFWKATYWVRDCPACGECDGFEPAGEYDVAAWEGLS
jgi:hypothetical protein